MNVYFIDSYKAEQNHGLNTYTRQLGAVLETSVGITLTYVWLDAIVFHSPTKKSLNGIAHLYVPPPQVLANQTINAHLIFAEVIKKELTGHKDALVHFNWINHLPIAWYLKKLCNCFTILTKHCIPWRDLVTNHYSSFYKINEAFEKGDSFQFGDSTIRREMVGYDAIDHIITVTDCAKKSLTQFFEIDAKKITKINNGLDHKRVVTSFNGKAKLRHKYGFRIDEQLLMYAGNVNPRKGIFDVVDNLGALIKKYPNLRLLIAGPGNYNSLLERAKGSLGRITPCGSLDKPTLYDFYDMCDIGIVPSYVEQCSYTCIEMMHSGLPLLVSDVDGLKEMVNDDCGLRLRVDFEKNKALLNPHDLLSKVSFLLDNPQKRRQLAKNAKQYAGIHFTAERMTKETIAVYEKAIKQKEEKQQVVIKSNKVKNDVVPLVSIVMPCYNAERYLQECLNSIYIQTFTNFEIILVNDGSTDNTSQIIASQKDPRIVMVNNAKNCGVAASLNQAIGLAKGKYIARMDADDSMNKDRLHIQQNFLESNADYGLVGSWYYVIDALGVPLTHLKTLEKNEQITLAMLFYNPISHPTVMMRSELAKSNLYNVEFNRCEDYELWFRLAGSTKLKNLPVALVNYRTHAENTTRRHQKEMQQNVMGLLSEALEKKGIPHTPAELMLHCAIGFGLGKSFFNSPERILALNNWLDKVFSAMTISKEYSKAEIKQFRNSLLAMARS